MAKTLFWPAAGETPPSSSTTASGVKQLREVDGIDTMCVIVLAFRERGIKRPADAAQPARPTRCCEPCFAKLGGALPEPDDSGKLVRRADSAETESRDNVSE